MCATSALAAFDNCASIGAYFLPLSSGDMELLDCLSCFSFCCFSFFRICCLRRLSLSFLPVSPTGDLLLVSSLNAKDALRPLLNLSIQPQYTLYLYSQGDY